MMKNEEKCDEEINKEYQRKMKDRKDKEMKICLLEKNARFNAFWRKLILDSITLKHLIWAYLSFFLNPEPWPILRT